MKLIFILSTILPLLHSTSAVCHACFDHICYTKRKIFEGEQLSGQIAIDRMDNLLHLHYKDFKATDHTAVVDLNYDNLKMHTLPISYSFARAVNQNTGEVYFSGSKGIYKYNALTRETQPYGLFRRQIWHMQYRDKLYFSEYQQKGLFYIENNRTKCVLPLADYVIDDFIIDKHDDIYFTSSYLLYRLKNKDITAQLFSSVLYSLATDMYDNAYFLDTNTRMLYNLNYTSHTLSQVGLFDEGTLVFRMVFDNLNRIIYCDASDDKVYLLSPNYAICSLTVKV